MKPDAVSVKTLVAIGLIRRGDCYLVGRRGSGKPLPDMDEFPGGKCRPAESPEQCVIRECREETGLEIVIRGRRKEVSHQYAHGLLRLTFFDCEYVGDAEPRPPFRWVLCSELANLNFPEANRSIIADLMAERMR